MCPDGNAPWALVLRVCPPGIIIRQRDAIYTDWTNADRDQAIVNSPLARNGRRFVVCFTIILEFISARRLRTWVSFGSGQPHRKTGTRCTFMGFSLLHVATESCLWEPMIPGGAAVVLWYGHVRYPTIFFSFFSFFFVAIDGIAGD